MILISKIIVAFYLYFSSDWWPSW